MNARNIVLAASAAFATMLAAPARAQTDDEPTGAPPPDAKALVEAPKAAEDEPTIEAPTHSTTVSLSAGGQWASGNSSLFAGTVNGVVDARRGANGFGASVLGNYGQSAGPGKDAVATAENLQGRLRYDRFVAERASFFGIVTGRHDRFQGLDFRLNLDPGFKYILSHGAQHSLWLEAGYDFQYDVRRDEARGPFDADGNAIPQTNPPLPILDKTATDHSGRLFAGYRHAFNKEVTLVSGLEYLQSVVDSTRYRVNFDALLAAKIGAGLSVGVGFGLRYDHAPLPTKEHTDTMTTVSLIYAFSDVPDPAPAPCPTTPAPDPAPPAAAPANGEAGPAPAGGTPLAPPDPPAPPPATP